MNIESVVLFQIDKTSKVSKLYSQREFDRLGLKITVEQWILLKIVHENKDISQNELAEKSLRDPASITRTLDLLQKKGYIERQPVANNRRQYVIELTVNGFQFVTDNLPIITEHRAKSIENMTKDEVALLVSLLKKIQHNLK